MHINHPEADLLLDRPLKLAFFDIDGTLLGLDGNYTRRVADAIGAVQKAGMKTAIASGRPKFAANFLIEELNIDDAGLFCTGAHLECPKSGAGQIALHALEDKVVVELLTAAAEEGVYTELCGKDDFYVADWPHIGKLHSTHLRAVPIQVDNLAGRVGREPVIKLLFAVTRRQDHQKLLRLEQRFPNIVFAYAKMAAEPDWLFVSVISDKGCKRQGFQRLLDFHQVKAEEVISFGDAQSDKIFLEMAGIGVAMGNAAEDVVSVADLQTLPVWEDGVAEVLERHLTLRGLSALA